MRRPLKFLKLPSAEKQLLIRACILLETIKFGFELVPFSALRKLLKFNRKFSEYKLFWSRDITRYSRLLAQE